MQKKLKVTWLRVGALLTLIIVVMYFAGITAANRNPTSGAWDWAEIAIFWGVPLLLLYVVVWLFIKTVQSFRQTHTRSKNNKPSNSRRLVQYLSEGIIGTGLLLIIWLAVGGPNSYLSVTLNSSSPYTGIQISIVTILAGCVLMLLASKLTK